MIKVTFLETDFAGLSDFSVVWYSEISSDLPSNFQGKQLGLHSLILIIT
jgi:hypothetical protein